MANLEQQVQALTSQIQQLTAQLSSQQQELGNTRAALEQQTQATSAALSVAQAAITQLTSSSQPTQAAESKRKPLNFKLVKAPEPFLGTEADRERFKFSFTSWIGTVDPEYPQAAMQADEMDPIDMTHQAGGFCTDLFLFCLRTFPSARQVPVSDSRSASGSACVSAAGELAAPSGRAGGC